MSWGSPAGASSAATGVSAAAPCAGAGSSTASDGLPVSEPPLAASARSRVSSFASAQAASNSSSGEGAGACPSEVAVLSCKTAVIVNMLPQSNHRAGNWLVQCLGLEPCLHLRQHDEARLQRRNRL